MFVNQKEGAEELANHLNEDLHNRNGRPSAQPGFATTAPRVFLSIHGAKSQHERTDVIRKVTCDAVDCVCAATHHSRHSQFKKGIAKGLVATDVAARGLDIKVRCSAFAMATQCCVSSVVLLLAGYSHCSELRRSNEDRHTRSPMRPHRTYGAGWS